MSEPALETLTPTVNKVWRCDVNTGTAEVPVWTQVRSIVNLVPSMPKALADDTDYDTPGNWTSQGTQSRSWALTLTVQRKKDSDDSYAAQEGQNALKDAAWDDDNVDVRWYERGILDGDAYRGTGTVSWDPQGGAGLDYQTISVPITGKGAPEKIEHPETPETP